ncbi:MAG: CPBP family intramembrane metalloprotease [Propionibacteriaceae bacterium]|jgi:membrane protease YdiL (CAAX protease family)|nr:CPBP family intramembrane metalloprotease [Propionibacteriaceae bacterium]
MSKGLSPLTRPIEGSTYPESLTGLGDDPRMGSLRFIGIVMAILVVTSQMILVPVFNMLFVGVGYLLGLGGEDVESFFAACQIFAVPWGILSSHAALGMMILIVWAYLRFIHRRGMRWLWSVSAGVRVRYAVVCALVSIPIIGAVAAYYWATGPGWSPLPQWGWFLVVVLITTPFQALAEEVVFRGYLMQALGSVVRNVWFPIIGTALVFAIFHGVQNPWLFGSRFVFGILAGILVWRTGGLEAAVMIHIINNLFAFGLAIFMGNLVEIRTTTEVAWTQSLSDVVMFAVCAAACVGVAIAMRVPMRVGKPSI